MESSVSWWVTVLGSNAARVVSLSLLRLVSSFPFRQSSPTPGRGVFCVFPERLVFFSLWPLIRSLSGSFWVCCEVEYKFIFFVRMYHSSRIFCWKNLPLSTPAQWHFCCQPGDHLRKVCLDSVFFFWVVYLGTGFVNHPLLSFFMAVSAVWVVITF